jgi:RND family efflux transporter MFP subunit
MNFRKLFIAAVILNIILAGVLVWKLKPSQPSQPTMAEPNTSSAPAQDMKLAEPQPAPIQLTPERMQAIGVTFGTVELRPVASEIRATGNVQMDERRQAYVQTRFAGWIRKVNANATYQYISRGEALFTIYSPELVATQQEYLLALKNQKLLQTSTVAGVAEGATSLASAARDRLRRWEVPDSEIAKVAETGEPIDELTINSPVSGYVTERNAFPNMYVQPETKLYTVADLSSVWVYAQVFQNDVGKIKAGDPADVAVDAYPGKSFRGHVEQVLPDVDMATRTVRVRLAFANPGLLLKPGMFVNVALKTPAGKALQVPASAVLQSGTKQIVFIDRGNGFLDPKEVVLGERSGDFYVVREGVKAGDRVVTSANFLIDSESQLQAAAGNFAPPPPGAGGMPANPKSQATAELMSDPNPPHKGKNVFRVKLTSADGKPFAGAQVTVTFFMPAMAGMGMAEMRTVLPMEDRGNGLYEASGELGSGGTWQVTIVAKQNGQVLLNKQLTVSATGGM